MTFYIDYRQSIIRLSNSLDIQLLICQGIERSHVIVNYSISFTNLTYPSFFPDFYCSTKCKMFHSILNDQKQIVYRACACSFFFFFEVQNEALEEKSFTIEFLIISMCIIINIIPRNKSYRNFIRDKIRREYTRVNKNIQKKKKSEPYRVLSNFLTPEIHLV